MDSLGECNDNTTHVKKSEDILTEGEEETLKLLGLEQKRRLANERQKKRRTKLKLEDPDKYEDQKQINAERQRNKRAEAQKSEVGAGGGCERNETAEEREKRLAMEEKRKLLTERQREKRAQLRQDDPDKYEEQKQINAERQRKKRAEAQKSKGRDTRNSERHETVEEREKRLAMEEKRKLLTKKQQEKRAKLRKDDPDKYEKQKQIDAERQRKKRAEAKKSKVVDTGSSKRLETAEEMEKQLVMEEKRKLLTERQREKRAQLRQDDPDKYEEQKQINAERQRKKRTEAQKSKEGDTRNSERHETAEEREKRLAMEEKRKLLTERQREKRAQVRQGDPDKYEEQKRGDNERRKEGKLKRKMSNPADWEEYLESRRCMEAQRVEALKTPTRMYLCRTHGSSEVTVSPVQTDTPGTPSCTTSKITPVRCRRALFQDSNSEENGPSCEIKISGGRKVLPKLMSKYFAKVRLGPTWICSCCGGLFYEKSVWRCDRARLVEMGLTNETIKLIINVSQPMDIFCKTCLSYIRKKKIPKLALSNGLEFPMVPIQLKDLTQLEQRLVAARLPFMQIKLLGFDQQWSLRGNVVNVENNLETCVKYLPRDFNEASVIQLKLMRRMHYKKPYLYEKIRPKKVIGALRFLLATELYQKYGISLNENWNYMNLESAEFVEENANEKEDEVPRPDSAKGSPDLENENETIEDLKAETEDNGTVDDRQTLLFVDDLGSFGIKIAPGEGNVPVPFHRDPDAEFLSFPAIYCGQPRRIPQELKLSYTDIVKSELRRHDRRCAIPEKILFSFKKSFNDMVRNAYSVCLRQKPGSFQGSKLTAGMLKDSSTVSNIIARDDGYAVFKKVRSTPAFWKDQCKKVTSMVRQLGACTFFITLSAAESKWGELLSILKKVVDNQLVGSDEAVDLPREERARLVQTDPVTCMRHFDYKYRELLNILLKPATGIFEPYGLNDWYSRIEYQMRGSPHSHGLYWLQDAPAFNPQDESSRKICTDFIDQFITCAREEEGDLKDVIGYQLHRHSHTCRKAKRSTRQCRFKFPKPPMEETMILDPLPPSFDKKERDKLTKTYTAVETELNKLGRNFKEDMTVDQFLMKLGIQKTEYIECIRTTIKRPAVFLKRLPKEAFMNPYNRDLLLAWRANMDIQFVLDGYACAKYVASYISKSGGGVSKLLRAASADVRDGNDRILNKLERFASILINGSEISAQEAAAFCLGMPMTNSSRSDVFVNTLPCKGRVKMTLSKDEIEKLEDDSRM